MRHLKVKYKMALFVAIVVAMLIGLGTIGISFTQKMAKRSQETYSGNLQPIYLITELRANNRAIESFLLEALLTKETVKSKELTEGIQQNISKNNELLEQLKLIALGC